MSEPTATDQARWAKWDDLRTRQELATTDEEREALKIEEEELREEGIKELFMQEITTTDPTWFWLSFADGTLPEGEQFLGVAIVPGSGVMSASLLAHTIGVNPGGEVQAIEIPHEHLPDEKYRMRLLSKEELEKAGLA